MYVKTKFAVLKYLSILLLWSACSEQDGKQIPLFSALNPEETGIFFENKITEGLNTNVLMYEYFYNGGGVAVGDFNGDGLEDLYFTSNLEDNVFYLNKGNFTFEDQTATAGLKGRKGPWKTGATAVDINNDGKLDLYLSYSGTLPESKRRNQLFLNLGNDNNNVPRFTDAAKTYGLDSPGFSNQAYFFDCDNDGDIDMLLLNHNPKSLPVLSEAKTKAMMAVDDPYAGLRLFKQANNYFTDSTPESGLNGSALSYGLGIGLGDFNNDGWVDFYLSNDYTIPDYLYINQQDGTFKNELQEAITQTSHFSMGNDIADLNNDSFLDIVTLDMLPEDNKRQKLLKAPDNYNKYDLNLRSGFHHQFMRNMVQMNNGNGTFSEIGQYMGVSNTDWSWAALLADYDNDGWNDLFVTNGYKRDYTNRDFLNYMEDFIANRKTKLQRADVLEIINNMPASNVRNYIYRNKEGKRFENTTDLWGLKAVSNSNGAAFSDLDNDGDLDLVVNNINAAVGVFRNNANTETKRNLQLRLEGTVQNRLGLGSRVTVYADSLQWVREQFITRGYLSNVSPVMHFGLGNREKIDSLTIRWADGKVEKQTNIATNNTLVLRHRDAKRTQKKTSGNTATLFKQIDNILLHSDKEAKVLDFNRQKLLHFQPSFTGPVMATADLNNDGMKDVIIGGGQNQATSIWMQEKMGTFSKKEMQAFAAFKNYVDTAIIPMDANNDGFTDLYIGSGGYHDLLPEDTKLQDRLYINTGQGEFNYAPKALPKNFTVTASVQAADVNNDGAIDLFVGGGIVPGAYPEHYKNRLLINNGKGNFTNQTQTHMAAFENYPGIIRDAIWTDINNDTWPDLLAVGEWMRPTLLVNHKGKLEINNDKFPITMGSGWNNTAASADFNADGFPDFVLGNEGLNTQYQIDENSPIEIVYGDFDNNESIDPIMQYDIQGTAYPMAPRDELLNQLAYLKSKYPSYASYAEQTVGDIFSPEQIKNAKTLRATTMETGILLSQADGNYQFEPLPGSAQFSPVYTVVIEDFNKDGNADLLLAGNRTKMAIKLGRYDTHRGLVYFGNGKGSFKEMPQRFTGLALDGDVRSVAKINEMWLFGIHGQPLKIYRLSK